MAFVCWDNQFLTWNLDKRLRPRNSILFTTLQAWSLLCKIYYII